MTRPHEDVIREALLHLASEAPHVDDGYCAACHVSTATESLAALVDERNRWMTPFDGSGTEWHESLPNPYTYQPEDFSKLVAAVHEYECERNRLREALVFYAKDENWDSTLGPFPRATRDGGRVAREALAASPGDKTPEASGPGEQGGRMTAAGSDERRDTWRERAEAAEQEVARLRDGLRRIVEWDQFSNQGIHARSLLSGERED